MTAGEHDGAVLAEADEDDEVVQAADGAETGTEASDGEVPLPPPDPALRRHVRQMRALVVLLLLALLAVVLLGLRVLAADAETSNRDEATSAARTVAEQLVTIGSGDAQQHIDVMLALSTDPFRGQLTGMASAFQEILKEGQVVAQGTVDSVGVQSIGDGQARVMATANTLVRNSQIPAGAPRDYRLQIGLREVDGRWKVSSVDVAK